MLEAALLTPLLLGAEPARVEIPDWSYDHQTQTSILKSGSDKRRLSAWTQTWSDTHPVSDSDSDPDVTPKKCIQVCAQWNVFNPRLCFRYKTVCTDAPSDPG